MKSLLNNLNLLNSNNNSTYGNQKSESYSLLEDEFNLWKNVNFTFDESVRYTSFIINICHIFIHIYIQPGEAIIDDLNKSNKKTHSLKFSNPIEQNSNPKTLPEQKTQQIPQPINSNNRDCTDSKVHLYQSQPVGSIFYKDKNYKISKASQIHLTNLKYSNELDNQYYNNYNSDDNPFNDLKPNEEPIRGRKRYRF